MFEKVLIANRGAIACRISRTLRRMRVRSVAVYSEADRHTLHTRLCDESVEIGPAEAAQSYLSIPAILEAARATGAQAIHPGYGFLSEDAAFAEACAGAGLVFIGPTPDQLRRFGLKHTARAIARETQVPLLPGTDLLHSFEQARTEASRIGYPVMLKSSAGGGGIGMRLCAAEENLAESYAAVERLSRSNFGAAGLYLEKFIADARHIEVQIFGDGKGGVLALGERDCSAQRRNQKVMEETPAPGLSEATRQRLFQAAVALGRAVEYQSAGTVEFLYDNRSAEFYFLEVNTRLQVEHGVTEEVTGIDLVEWMVRQAAGGMTDLEDIPVRPVGSSLQVRCYAEDPGKQFQPSAGRLLHVAWPAGCRVETWVEPGTVVTPYYDPMLAKIIVHGATRQEAVERMGAALDRTSLAGIETNLHYLRQVVRDETFAQGAISTAYLGRFPYRRGSVEILDGGMQTTVQDYPGRLGLWNVGVPPSGPMDAFAFRAANALTGNEPGAPALEMTLTGPTLVFHTDTVIAVTGADFAPLLNDEPLELWQPVPVKLGSILRFRPVKGGGARGYLAFAGGIEAPPYLESASTFLLGGFGGVSGRALRVGDVLHLGPPAGTARQMEAAAIPVYGKHWRIGVLNGPHGAPDYFTGPDIAAFFSAAWTVHHNSDRTGIRLIGPKPQWARKDGGEAGLHPSNIHDNAYAIGAVDFTGDMPVILGPDGPSLGGFVCPATIVEAERWKMGQLKAGDRVTFVALTEAQARALDLAREHCLETLAGAFPDLPGTGTEEPAVVSKTPFVVCRAAGDRNLLVEYGENILDLNLRIRIHALEQELRRAQLPGIIDITPGVRSLQIHYSAALRREALLEALAGCEQRIGDLSDYEVPSRTVYLPLSWDDPATQLAIRKYMQSVRPDAPWCPSNLEFIRRINGLSSIDSVNRIVHDASYLVLGLGDVYLGAPVATPVDPRHRLVTTKYNPARTWTPENAVGIGGAYLCVYGMEGPGGYQFVGRTLQMWNTFAAPTPAAPTPAASTPWLLRFFDQLHFFPVSADELLRIREEFPYGGYPLRVEEHTFQLSAYNRFLHDIAPDAKRFKDRQQEAFVAERERWAAAGLAEYMDAPETAVPVETARAVPEGCSAVLSPVTAAIWTIGVAPGEAVIAGQRLLILEAMKSEIAVVAPVAGTVESIDCQPGAMVITGQQLAVIREHGA